MKVTLGDLVLWYSYQTIVAFKCSHTNNWENRLLVRQNDWHQTTGKHLNWIDGGKQVNKHRVTGEQFEEALREALQAHKLEE